MTETKIQYVSDPMPVSMGDDWFDIAGEDNFWMKWRYYEIKKILKNRRLNDKSILEVGCGSGVVMKQFYKDQKIKIDGCDLNEFAMNKIGDVDSNVYCYNIFDRDDKMMDRYSGIFLLDVIEHIEDDVTFLKASLDHINKGDMILINVPAYNHLYSKYDIAVGHYRRYTKSMMLDCFEGAGIEPLKLNYWAFGLYPIAIIRKAYMKFKTENIIKDGLKPPNSMVSDILKTMAKTESALPFNMPIGASLLALGTKK